MSYNIRTIDRRTVQQSLGRFIAAWLFVGVGSTIGLTAVQLTVKITGVYPEQIEVLSWAPYVGLLYVTGAWLPALLIFPAVPLWKRLPGKRRHKYVLSVIFSFVVLIPLFFIGLFTLGATTPVPNDIWGFGVVESLLVVFSVWLPALFFPMLVEWLG